MMISILKALVLGMVEGITEFLPISSTGHLILVNQWISFSESFTKMFDIVIQLGAILAVVVYFWSKLWPFGREETKKSEIFSTWKKTIVGVIPAILSNGISDIGFPIFVSFPSQRNRSILQKTNR